MFFPPICIHLPRTTRPRCFIIFIILQNNAEHCTYFLKLFPNVSHVSPIRKNLPNPIPWKSEGDLPAMLIPTKAALKSYEKNHNARKKTGASKHISHLFSMFCSNIPSYICPIFPTFVDEPNHTSHMFQWVFESSGVHVIIVAHPTKVRSSVFLLWKATGAIDLPGIVDTSDMVIYGKTYLCKYGIYQWDTTYLLTHKSYYFKLGYQIYGLPVGLPHYTIVGASMNPSYFGSRRAPGFTHTAKREFNQVIVGYEEIHHKSAV